MQYCSLQHRTLLPSPVTYNWLLFLLWLHLFILSGVISPLFSSSILGTCWPREFTFQCLIFLPFHNVHGVLKVRILKWFAIPFFSGPHFFRTLHHDPATLGGPTWHGSLFYWGRQGCGPLWSGIRLYIVNVDAIAQISVAMAQEYSKYCIILPMTYMLYKVLTFCLLSFSLEQWEYWKMFLKTLPFHLVIWFLCL